MKLYTGTGDQGFTILPGSDGRTHFRVRKDDPRLAALGTLDELAAAIGLCLTEARRAEEKAIAKSLRRIQDKLLRVGAVLAAIGTGGKPPVQLDNAAVSRIEKEIDAICASLGRLRKFVIPGGCELAGRLHLARSIARRAERTVVTALSVSGRAGRDRGPAGLVAKYLNRLSDLLFALARQANHNAGQSDATWKP